MMGKCKRTLAAFLAAIMLAGLFPAEVFAESGEGEPETVEEQQPESIEQPEETPIAAPAETEPTPEPTPEPERFYEIYGLTVSSYDEEADFSGIPVTDKGAALEELLPELPNLRRVIMSDCGLSNEEMDELNRRHEDIRFIWTVYFGTNYHLRTDETFFIASIFEHSESNFSRLYDVHVECLKYCVDMEALDLGHMPITNCDFCSYMPNLRYLILVNTQVADISPLAGCKDLYFLELFKSPVNDLSPLLECPNLKYLNISWCNKITDISPVLQMPQLEALWCVNPAWSYSMLQAMRDGLPEHTIQYVTDTGVSLSGGWRNQKGFYEMRDAMDSYYSGG